MSAAERGVTACPNAAAHADQPEGYIAAAYWARRMMRTHRQRKCPGCGLWAIWEPKVAQLITEGER